MQRSIQSVETGQSADELEICPSAAELCDGDLPYDVREHDGDRSDEEHTLRLFDVGIIEMECLRGQEGELVVKELSLCNGDCQQQYIFRPPYILRNPDSKFKNKWLRKNINGFSWYDGYLDYSQLERFVRQFGRRYKRLFTKGDEKAMLLTNLCGMPVEDLGKYGAPKQKTIKLPTKRCQFHLNKPQLQCAVDKSIKFYG